MILVWLSGLSAAILFSGIAWYLMALDPNIVSLQFAYSPRLFGEIVHVWGPELLERYRRHLPYDFGLLVSYGAFGYLLVTRTRVFAGSRMAVSRLAQWALPIAASFDALENGLHGWLTTAPRFGVPWAYALSSGASAVKWLFLAGFVGLVVLALVRTED